jgi:hypothetical protein
VLTAQTPVTRRQDNNPNRRTRVPEWWGKNRRIMVIAEYKLPADIFVAG